MKRGRKPKCPFCGVSRNIAKGKRPTVTLGPRSLRVCKNCGRKFTVGRTLPVALPLAGMPPKLESLPARELVAIQPGAQGPVENCESSVSLN